SSVLASPWLTDPMVSAEPLAAAAGWVVESSSAPAPTVAAASPAAWVSIRAGHDVIHATGCLVAAASPAAWVSICRRLRVLLFGAIYSGVHAPPAALRVRVAIWRAWRAFSSDSFA